MATGRRPSRAALNRAQERVRVDGPPQVPTVKVTDAQALIIRTQPLPTEMALLVAGFQPGRTTWMGAEQPAAAWTTMVDAGYTRNGIMLMATMTPANRPVPRQASCHYYNDDLTQSTSSTYFY